MNAMVQQLILRRIKINMEIKGYKLIEVMYQVSHYVDHLFLSNIDF